MCNCWISGVSSLGAASTSWHSGNIAAAPGAVPVKPTVVLILVVRLLATFRIEPFLILFDPAYRAEFYVHAQAARADAAHVAAIPGPVACTLKVVCRMAGKPYVWDDFRTDMMIYTGAAKGLDAVGLIRQHGYTYYENDSRADIRSLHRAIVGPP